MIEQGSPEWFAARCGKATASRIADIVAKTKTGYSTSRANYMAQLICERLTGAVAESFTNAAMQWGTEKEPEARDAYAFLRDVDVEQVGLIDHPRISLTSASPDGLVGADGMVEIKCPITATHIETLRTGAIPGKYVTQMQWQLACAGRQWCDFVSYDPRMPEEMRLFVSRVMRDDAHIAQLEADVIAFLDEIDAAIDDLKAQYMPANDSGVPNLLMAG